MQEPLYHRYPFSYRTDINQAIATYYQNRFGAEIDPATEVQTFGGSAGIADIGLALHEPGDIGLVTDPVYGSHGRAVEFAGARCISCR